MKPANSLTIKISKSTKNGFTLNFVKKNRARWAIVLWLCHWCITYLKKFSHFHLYVDSNRSSLAVVHVQVIGVDSAKEQKKRKILKEKNILPVPIPFFPQHALIT
jgi:hypothetical protein